MMAARQWRILVVGGGSIGRRHLQNLLALGQRTVCVVDADRRVCEEAAQRFECPAYAELEEGLGWGPEAVVVATPTSDHLATAMSAVRRGCHLFIEKPLADRLEGVEELARAVHERHLTALVGCNMRFHPGPRLVHDALAQGTVGTPLSARLEAGSYLPSWRPGTDYRRSYSARPELGGGCLLDMIHELDLACWMFGFPHKVMAMTSSGRSLEIAAEASAEILLRYDTDFIVSIHLDYVQRWRQRRCEVIGERGTVVWESRRADVAIRASETEPPHRLGYDADYDINQMYGDEFRHWLRCLEGLETPLADVQWAARVLQVALAAKASAGRQQPVELAVDEDFAALSTPQQGP